jgi:hypothetical protein
LFGDTLTPIYISQTLLSLLNIALVYALALWLTTNDQRPTTDDQQRTTGDRQPTTDRRSRSPLSVLRSTLSVLRSPDPRLVPFIAALLTAIYFPFAVYPQVLLSETLYLTLLLGGFLALFSINDDRPRPAAFVLAGILFGCATLTRSLTLLFVPIIALWMMRCWILDSVNSRFLRLSRSRVGSGSGPSRPPFSIRERTSSLLAAAVFCLSALGVVLPWTIYNSRVFGGLVLVDTSGAFNLLVGARAAYDGRRSDEIPRNFVLALLDERLTSEARRALLEEIRLPGGETRPGACLLRRQDPRLLAALQRPVQQISQADRQQLMAAEGLCLIAARPGAFVTKTLAELVDLFQINYTGDERFTDGFTTGRLPPWYVLGLFLLDDTLYVLVLPLAVVGWVYLRNGERERMKEDRSARFIVHPSSLVLLWWLYNIATAPLLFAINRFRLPLLPFACICAAVLVQALQQGSGIRGQPSSWLRPGRSGTIRHQKAVAEQQTGAASSRTAAAARAQGQPQRTVHRRAIRSSGLVVALLLCLVSMAPWAYVWAGAPPSYLGPYPSSLESTRLALATRPIFLHTEALRAALARGDAAEARQALDSGPVNIARASKSQVASDQALAEALLARLEGRPHDGLRLLPSNDVILATGDVEAAVVRADLLRSTGDEAGARALLTPRFVDSANPVRWAWDWLWPAAARRIDLGGNLDLGYIRGCYLGEGDPSGGGTFRWCTDGVQLRFPGSGSGDAQQLVLRVDGRGWRGFATAVPPVRVFTGETEAGVFTPAFGVAEFTVSLPPAPPGADMVVTLHTPVFYPTAATYLSQQGALVGQAPRLGVRLDWAELRP